MGSELRPIREDPKPPVRSKSRFRIWLKTFGLWSVQAWRREEEHPKIAIYQDRKAAALRCLIHLAPVSGVIALLRLNLSGTFIGATMWPQTTSILQFVAKLHEILMVSSLAVVLASYTHHHLTSDRGLPFGAAFATTQVHDRIRILESSDMYQVFQLSYLVSPELLGAARAISSSWQLKPQLLLVLVLFPLLISTVGPASAACLIPRLGSWPWITLIYGFNETRDDLFPVNLDLDGPAAAIWAGTAMDSFVRFMPLFEGTQWHNRNSSILWPVKNVYAPLTLYTQNQGPDMFTEIEDSVYTATTSLQNVALSSPPPAFLPSWVPWVFEDSMDAFSNVSCPVRNEVPWKALDESLPPPSLIFDSTTGAVRRELDALDTDQLRSSLLSYSPYQLLLENVRFFELPGTSTIGIVYFTVERDSQNTTFLGLHPCTATLGWYSADLRFTGQVFQSRSPPNLQEPDRQIRPASIPTSSVRNMNLLPSSPLSDVLIEFVDIWQNPTLAPFAISVMLTVTLSAASGTVSSSSSMDYCGSQFYQCGDYFGSRFRMKSFRYGYGYGADITSVRISLAILMLYCVIAIMHTAFIIYTGRTSTAWDSIAEFVALAMGSRKPAELRNTSAGIDRAQVFEHRVRIAATVGEGGSWSGGEDHEGAFEPAGKHLELIFPSTEGAVLSKVRSNVEYADSST